MALCVCLRKNMGKCFWEKNMEIHTGERHVRTPYKVQNIGSFNVVCLLQFSFRGKPFMYKAPI